jgi:ribose transport system permease protein/putative xylitol transport system permease protein
VLRLRRRPGGSQAGIVAIFVLLLVVLSATTPDFASSDNVTNILQQNAILGIVACGMLFMIILGGFDLSVGAVGAMSSVVAAALMPDIGIPLAVAAALAMGLMVGLVNGFSIAKVGMNPFVATLAMQVLILGLMFVATDAKPVYGVPESFTVVGLGKAGPMPVATLILVGVAIFGFLLLRFTRFGHHMYAVGGGREASALAGISVDRVTLVTYGLGALLAALAGIVMLGQTTIGQPNSATTWPLAAIGAVVVGGVPLSGGSGGIGAALLGTFLLGVIANALNLLDISPYWQPAVSGLVILIAVGADSYRRKRSERG